uniref:FAD-dependent oxidoreductase domain-containing protein 2 isoform X1 n=1 Tax=Myxine glutinosa TaxID=7769 RepID=UPI00358EE1F6
MSPFRRGLGTAAILTGLVLVMCEVTNKDYCIIGAGPGGLQMAYFLQQAGRDYVVLERNNISGSFFVRYPRHRKLISINKRYTGTTNVEFSLRHDWNSLLSHDPSLLYRHYSRDFFPHADTMLQYLQDYTMRLRLRVRYGTEVTSVATVPSNTTWNDHVFRLSTRNGDLWTCNIVLVATGLSMPNEPNFLGSELSEGYESVSVDPSDFEGQRVLILGLGNSAFETADRLMGTTSHIHLIGRSRVRLAWSTHYVGDIRAVNNDLLDTYQLKSLNGILEASVDSLKLEKTSDGRLQAYLGENGDWLPVTDTETGDSSGWGDNYSLREPYDRIIRCLGFHFDFSIFEKSLRVGPAERCKRKYPLVQSSHESPSTPGLFFIGTIGHSLDHRKAAGGFIHGFRYTARTVHRLLEFRNHHVPWPTVRLPISQLFITIVRRINEASGPYQMFSVLADVVLLKKNATEFEYLEEYPISALSDFEANTGRVADEALFVINLEYGKNFSGPGLDVFSDGRADINPFEAWNSNFLHPVIYYYLRLPTANKMQFRPKGWTLPRPTSIHHIVEDFLTVWTAPVSHLLPLRRFLESCLHSDLRNFFAETCFHQALTARQQPITCQQGYLQGAGLGAGRWLQNVIPPTLQLMTGQAT